MQHATRSALEEMAAQGADKVSAYLRGAILPFESSRGTKPQHAAEDMPCDMRCGSCRHCGVVASALRGCRVGTAGLQRQRCWADVAGVPRRRCGDGCLL